MVRDKSNINVDYGYYLKKTNFLSIVSHKCYRAFQIPYLVLFHYQNT